MLAGVRDLFWVSTDGATPSQADASGAPGFELCVLWWNHRQISGSVVSNTLGFEENDLSTGFVDFKKKDALNYNDTTCVF